MRRCDRSVTGARIAAAALLLLTAVSSASASLMGVDIGLAYIKVSVARPGKGLERTVNQYRSKGRTVYRVANRFKLRAGPDLCVLSSSNPFIVNLSQLSPTSKQNGKRRLSFSSRMTVSDYLAMPLLLPLEKPRIASYWMAVTS
jgi:hypothetical protein